MSDAADPVQHVVVLASTRRPELLGETVRTLFRQTRPADAIVLSVPDPADVPADVATDSRVTVVISERGLTVQRNTGVHALGTVPDLITFIDDDAVLADDYFEHLRRFMDSAPDVVLMTGLVVADGIAQRRELSRAEAATALADAPRRTTVLDSSAYGCNMTVRGRVAELEPFDERLRLYAWQEDTDFSARCRRHGRVVHYHGCVAVHLAVGSGRMNGRALGFAQVVNPFYLWRKGSKTFGGLLLDWWRYLGSNAVKVADRSRPDRKGRLAGNLLGLREVVLHGGRPEAVVEVAARSAPPAPDAVRTPAP